MNENAMPRHNSPLGETRRLARLVATMARRELAAEYAGSLFGFVWAFVHPLVLTLVYTFVFSHVFKAEIAGRLPGLDAPTVIPFPVWLLAGILPWSLFADTVSASATCLTGNAALVTRTLFPPAILPLTAFVSRAAKHAIGLCILLGLMASTGTAVGPAALALPAAFAAVGCLAVGLGLAVAALQVYVRDTAQVVQAALQILFFALPIVFEPRCFPESYRALIAYNPLAVAIEGYRAALIQAYHSPLADPTPARALVLTAFCLGCPLLGLALFRRLRQGFADVL